MTLAEIDIWKFNLVTKRTKLTKQKTKFTRVKNTYRQAFPSATPKLAAFGYVKVEFNEKTNQRGNSFRYFKSEYFTVPYNLLMGVQESAGMLAEAIQKSSRKSY